MTRSPVEQIIHARNYFPHKGSIIKRLGKNTVLLGNPALQRIKVPDKVTTLITVFSSGLGYYLHFVDIIHISWKYPHFVDISTFCGYCPHFVDIICIGHSTSYLARNVCHVIPTFILVVDNIYISHILHSFVLVIDITCIGHSTRYLACNVLPAIHIYSSSVSDWCIASFPVLKLICFSVLSFFRLVRFVSDYKLNPNPIRIYITPFITSIKANFPFPLNILICALYWCVV